MKAVVLVGGEGTRLRPLTKTTPKPLLPVAGVPLVERQLQWLGAHGVDEVVLAMGYLPDAFVEHFPDDRFQSIHLLYAVESEPLGTAGAIRFAAEHAGFDDRFFVCNGDVLTTLDLSAFVDFHVAHEAAATIHLSRVDDPSALGAVPTYPDGEVEAFVEKPPPGTAPSNWINAGTYLLERSVLEHVPAGRMVAIEHETFPLLLQQRGQVYALETDDYWLDVGTPQTYLRAHADVLEGRLGLPPAPDARESAPGVWVQGDADLASEVEVEAPVLVGVGASVAGGSRIERSSIGAGAEIQAGAVVAGAVVHSGARVCSGAVVRDSILGVGACVESDATVLEQSIVGPGASVPAGSTLAGGRVPVAASSD
ncbi:MAG: NDP-sugar synthase [Actinobacteria bacterium]|nr:NDP-sugar synthase [Actinomycetota bacterium]